MNSCIPEHHYDEAYWLQFDAARSRFEGGLAELRELVERYFGDDEHGMALYESLSDRWNAAADEAAERASED